MAMNNYYRPYFILLPVLVMLFAFTEGPPAGNTGSPLDGQNCTQCHGFLPAGNLPGWISSNIPDYGYTPGETYTITVTAHSIVAAKMGFQITSETQFEKMGTFIISDPDRTQLRGSTSVTHTTDGTVVTQLPASWSMNWVAPVPGSGEVNFYTAVNQTNNDNTNDGDLIFVSSLSVFEAVIGIPELLDNRVSQIYPNPAHEYINLGLPLQSEVHIINYMGREVMYYSSREELLKIDISRLTKGIYYVQIFHRGMAANRSFIKK